MATKTCMTNWGHFCCQPAAHRLDQQESQPPCLHPTTFKWLPKHNRWNCIVVLRGLWPSFSYVRQIVRDVACGLHRTEIESERAFMWG